jgi:hypothetical protein
MKWCETGVLALFAGAVWCALVTASASAQTPKPTPTFLPTPAPILTPIAPISLTVAPTSINGIAFDAFVWFPSDVQTNTRAIFAKGQSLGNNPTAFSAIGDSTIAGGQFLERFSKGDYNLGPYDFLQPTLDVFTSSLKRTSTTVRVGLHSWTALNPTWANKDVCKPNETPVACEFRINKPSYVFIRLGANDDANALFEKSMRNVLSYTVESGVVPILITKSNDPSLRTARNNASLRKLADEFKIPLVDFELVAARLPGRGVGSDGVHMTGYWKVDYTLPSVFNSGHAMHNLAVLVGLTKIYQINTVKSR